MKHRHATLKLWMAGLLVLVAAGIWVCRLWDSTSFDARALRDTQGVEVAVLDCRRVPRGYQILCRVTNHRNRRAAFVVLEASVFDREGRVSATNPLIDVKDLEAGRPRTLPVFVPTQHAIADAQATLEVSLVDWDGRP